MNIPFKLLLVISYALIGNQVCGQELVTSDGSGEEHNVSEATVSYSFNVTTKISGTTKVLTRRLSSCGSASVTHWLDSRSWLSSSCSFVWGGKSSVANMTTPAFESRSTKLASAHHNQIRILKLNKFWLLMQHCLCAE